MTTLTKIKETKEIPTYYQKFGDEWLVHREDGPAMELANGTKKWYFEGKLHREDGPAIEWNNGTKMWHFKGQCHRVDGPAIEEDDGTKKWYFENNRHRVDGPAVEYADGTTEWFFKGLRHRIDGPAIEYADGTKHWYFEGNKMTEEEFNEKIKKLNEIKHSDTLNGDTKSGGKKPNIRFIKHQEMTEEEFKTKHSDKLNCETKTILSIQKKYLENILKEHGFQESIFQEITKILELERAP